MSFKLRNTLFLITLVMLLGAGGYYVLYMYYPTQREMVQLEIAHFDSLEAGILERATYLEDLEKAPKEKPSLSQRLKWTGLVLVVFFIMGSIPIFGLSTSAQSRHNPTLRDTK